ncbi:glutamate 5-kinase [Ruminococcaceae bacterium OttesenSCG-928-L11]|nr:glutamate 5-kinase [Ruminococcaceae bacterium OttesenSCG-928-L11]
MNSFQSARRVVIKVGTSTLTYETGRANIRRMEEFVKVLADLHNAGREIILVTSGAISVGAGKMGLRERPCDVPGRQAAAAVGQCELMQLYDTQFQRYNHVVGQLLLTKDVVDDDLLRRNAINTLHRLLEHGAIPIINENDTVATDELEGECFGDNDTLSAMVAELVEADVLVILSDIEGLYDGNPRTNLDARLIARVDRIDEYIESVASGTGSNRGTGGMSTKIQAARIVERCGIDMAIISGEKPERLYDLFDGEAVGTHFAFRRI